MVKKSSLKGRTAKPLDDMVEVPVSSFERGEFFNPFGGAQVIDGTYAGHIDMKSNNKNTNLKSDLCGTKMSRKYKVKTEEGVILFDENIAPLANIFTNKGIMPGNRVRFEYLGARRPSDKELFAKPLTEKEWQKAFPKAKKGAKSNARKFLEWGRLQAQGYIAGGSK